MRIDDLINISGDSLESKIEEAIEKTKEELGGLTVETTCFIYSSALGENLRKSHINNRIESTTEYDYPYIHQFNTVRKNENEIYLIDLTYSQFQDTKYEELLQKGYMLIKEDELDEYLRVVGNVNQGKRKR